MKPLTQYGRMAEKHWREFLPKMVAELEAKGQLQEMLLEAEEQTEKELDRIRRQLIQQGLTAQQAHDQAWEMVRDQYIFLPPGRDAFHRVPQFVTKSGTEWNPSLPGSWRVFEHLKADAGRFQHVETPGVLLLAGGFISRRGQCSFRTRVSRWAQFGSGFG